MGDTCIGTVTDPKYMSVSSDDRRWKTKMRKLIEKYPDEVILKYDDDGYDYMTIWIPAEWVTIRKPVKRNLTDEQRAELSERFRRINSVSQYGTDKKDEIPFSDVLDGQIGIEDIVDDYWDMK